MGYLEEADVGHDKQVDRWMDAIDKMKLTWDSESINIYIDEGNDRDPIQLFYWHTDEILEDSEIILHIMNAIHLFYTNKLALIKLSTYR